MKKVLSIAVVLCLFVSIPIIGAVRTKKTHEKQIFVSPYAIENETEKENTYPRALVVDYNDIENGIVFFNDKVENEWIYETETDLETGDVVGAIFSDNGTPNYIYDDVILDIRYSF